jgi:hypothetical protein
MHTTHCTLHTAPYALYPNRSIPRSIPLYTLNADTWRSGPRWQDVTLKYSRVDDLPETASLKNKIELREKQLSELVVSAFEDANMPRDRFVALN